MGYIRKIFAISRMHVLLFGCVLNVFMPVSAFADGRVDSFRNQNDVLYSGEGNTCSSGSGDSSGGGCGEKGGFTGPACAGGKSNSTANKEQITSFLKGKGLTDIAVAGVLGNMQQESCGFMPDAYNGNSGANTGDGVTDPGGKGCRGIVQWCKSRNAKLEEFANKKGSTWDCLGTQLEFMWDEVSTGSESGVMDSLKAAKTPTDAANIWASKYERPGANEYAGRAEKAEAIYKGGGFDSSSPGSTGQSSSGCSSGVADDGSCKDPFRDIEKAPKRLDGGVDYGADNGSGPIYAACPAKIVNIWTASTGSGWPGDPGLYMTYQVTSGKAKDKYIYISEDCTPKVQKGQSVDTNTAICDYKFSSAWLEIGWSEGGNNSYISWSDYPKDSSSYASNSGQDMDKFLKSIGGVGGSIQGPVSKTPPPADWPNWTTGGATNA